MQNFVYLVVNIYYRKGRKELRKGRYFSLRTLRETLRTLRFSILNTKSTKGGTKDTKRGLILLYFPVSIFHTIIVRNKSVYFPVQSSGFCVCLSINEIVYNFIFVFTQHFYRRLKLV